MNKYGQATINTVKLLNSRVVNNPEEAWQAATSQIFGKGSSSQLKGCPKGAFLGLCENGYIKGIDKGKYTKSIKNKEYAIRAVNILKATPSLSNNPKKLWSLVMQGEIKVHNHQLDVVTYFGITI